MSTAQSESASPWQLTFIDGFSKGALDTSKWSVGYGWGRTSDGRRERVRDRDVWVDESTNELVLNIDHDGGDGWYSGAVNTRNKFRQQYGFFEAALRPPREDTGLLPAFWMKPNNEDWPPELDVVEWVGSADQSVHNTHFTNNSNQKDNEERVYRANSSLRGTYHIYGAHWTPEEGVWYVDGYEVGSATRGLGSREGQLSVGQPFYLMLSCHIWDQDWLGGSPEQLSNWPYELRCKWVRAWTRNDS